MNKKRKRKHRRSEPGFESKSKRRKRKKLQSRLILFAVPVTLLLVLLVTGTWPFNRNIEQQVAVDIEKSDFDQLIARGDIRQLTERALDILDNNRDSFPIKMDKIQKRLTIASRILESEPDVESRLHAEEMKLDALMEHELLCFQQDVKVEKNTSELEDFAKAQELVSENSVATNRAQLGLAVAALAGYAAAPLSQRSAGQAELVVRRLRMAAEANRDSTLAATIMLEWLSAIQARSSKFNEEQVLEKETEFDLLADFQNVIEKSFANSKNSEVAKILGDGDWRVAEQLELLNVEATKRDRIVEELIAEIEGTQKSDYSEVEFKRLLNTLKALLQAGKFNDAKRILSLVPESVVSATENENLRFVKQWIKIYDQPFDASGIQDTDGNPVDLKSGHSHIMCFVSHGRITESAKSVRELFFISRKHENTKVVIVFLDDGANDYSDMGLDGILQTTKNSPRLDFTLLQTKSPGGIEFLEKYLLDEIPFVLQLGENGKVLAANPTSDLVAEIMEKAN